MSTKALDKIKLFYIISLVAAFRVSVSNTVSCFFNEEVDACMQGFVLIHFFGCIIDVGCNIRESE